MTAALTIINRAAELIGYKDPDEPLSGNDAANFLGVLNSMVDEWNTKRLYIVSTQDVVTSISASPVTIGPGATVNVTRPVRIEDGSFTRMGGVDYPITWLTEEQYNLISVKSVSGGIPQYGFYDADLPMGSVYLWPVPASTVSLHLVLQTQLTEFADTGTDYDLAPGYRKALEYSLAEELAIGRRPLEPMLVRKAASARKAIKTVNFEPPQLDAAPRYETPYSRFLAGV